MGRRRLLPMSRLGLPWCGVRIRGGVLRRWFGRWRLRPISLLRCGGLLGMIGMGLGFWMFWRLCGLGCRRRRLGRVVRWCKRVAAGGGGGLAVGAPWLWVW